MNEQIGSETSVASDSYPPAESPLAIDSALEALRVSKEFQGPIESLEGVDDHKTCEHLALFYETREEQLATVVPFIKQGIERGERVMWVLEEHSKAELLDGLRDGAFDVDSAVESGQLSFHTLEETYLEGGYFDADEMIDFYQAAIDEATVEYPALRVTASTDWLLDEETSVEDFLDYESRVNELFEREDSIALCHYDCGTLPSEVLSDIVRTHPHIVYKNTVCHNFYFTPPAEYIDPDVDDQDVEHMLETLVDRTNARAELEETVEKLEESNDRLKRFAYIASHDLQEPLRMVSTYLQLLEDKHADQLDEEAREYIDFAVGGADRMREMVDGLLNYSRVDMHDEDFVAVDCNEVLEDVVADQQVKIEETGATVEIDDLPTVRGDANLLKQVFDNLVGNAIKYSGDEPPDVWVAAERHGTRYVFSVADEGIGMDPAHSEQIFEVFNRLHSNSEYQGTGIGLALCRKIVDYHCGDIWVETEPDDGTTFYFTLPEA